MKRTNAFSLIELSIVLVIVGLVAGGVIGGKSLIHSAELRAVVSDVQSYQTAINTFKLQYEALPGDLKDAYSYWGATCGQNNLTTQTNAAVNPPYCNGNNDGLVGPWLAQAESVMAWKHLYLAQLLPYALTGRNDTSAMTPNVASIGVNAPPSSITNSGFHLSTYIWGAAPPGGSAFGESGLHLMFGKRDTIWLDAPVVTPADASNIDQRMDDGNADNGKVMGFLAYLPPSGSNTVSYRCTSNNNPLASTSGSYDLDDPDEVCTMLFFME